MKIFRKIFFVSTVLLILNGFVFAQDRVYKEVSVNGEKLYKWVEFIGIRIMDRNEELDVNGEVLAWLDLPRKTGRWTFFQRMREYGLKIDMELKNGLSILMTETASMS